MTVTPTTSKEVSKEVKKKSEREKLGLLGRKHKTKSKKKGKASTASRCSTKQRDAFFLQYISTKVQILTLFFLRKVKRAKHRAARTDKNNMRP
jgi:hypothetical protein